jgi:hypothetical protein
MTNIAVFIPRDLTGWEFLAVCFIIVSGLGFMFYQGGEKIQQVLDRKTRS